MQNIDFKKLIPIVTAIVVFVILTYGYFSPMLKGKEIIQSDIVSVKGMAQEIIDARNKYHDEPLWTNSMFGGMPAYQINISYPNNLMQYARAVVTFKMDNPAMMLFTYLLGFFILLIVLKVNPWLSIIGSIAFAFSAYFIIIIAVGHTSKAVAIGWMAPVLAGFIVVNRGNYLWGSILLAFTLAQEIMSGHIQATYYFFLFIGIYLTFEWAPRLRNNKELKPFIKSVLCYVAAGIIAFGCNIGNLINTADYAKVTMRGGASELSGNEEHKTSGLDKDYITQWSMGISESMTLMIPGFKGRASDITLNENKNALKNVDARFKESIGNTPQYWGDQPFTISPYSGAIVVFLFVFGLFIIEGRLKWALLIATIFSFLLSWGRNFMPLTNFFIDYFPFYNKFRTVSMILMIAMFAIPLIAVLATDKLIKNPELFSKKIKLALIKQKVSMQNIFFISFALTGGLAFVFYLAPGLTELFGQGEYDRIYDQIAKSNGTQIAQEFMDNLTIARANLFKSDALRSFLFISAAAIVLWLYFKSKINKGVLIFGLGVLIFADLVPIDRVFLNEKNFKPKQEAKVPFPLTTADKEILTDTDPNYRVLNIAVNTFNESGTSYYHKSIGGYHAAKLRRYQDLIDYHLRNNIENIINTLRTRPTDSSLRATFAKQGVLNMLNTKYIIYNPDAAPLQNRYALGNAWFVDNIKPAKNADEEIQFIGEINPAQTAVINEKYNAELENFTVQPEHSAKITLTEYRPNHLIYESNTSTEQLAVFSEIYYNKGWNAYIDGEEKPYMNANYVLRAMRIPSGKHIIEFKFEPKTYFIGEKISLISNIFLFVGLGIAIFLSFRNRTLKVE